MKFGIYIHIPFCSKRCSYCDFAIRTKFNLKNLEDYTDCLINEIKNKSIFIKNKKLYSLYFGGGTPSLLPIKQIEKIIKNLQLSGFIIDKQTEVSIEMNPESVNKEKLTQYKNLGINRFSLGIQSFQKKLLKICNREHNVEDNYKSIDLLQGSNFSLDWLFALPKQNLELLKKDANLFTQSNPSHISSYLLNLQKFHPMNKNRPMDEEQIKMLEYIKNHLTKNNFKQYEISNFAKPNLYSRHNSLYWSDQEYLGIGLSAHSYFPNYGEWGARTWNSSTMETYKKETNKKNDKQFSDYYPKTRIEILSKSESLQDFCYTHLRTSHGLEEKKILKKFGASSLLLIKQRLANFVDKKDLFYQKKTWLLSPQGINISNNIFLELSFLKETKKG